MNIEERFKYYLGDFYNKKDLKIKIIDKYREFKQNGIYYYLGPNNYPENFKFPHGYIRPGWWWDNQPHYISINFPCLTNSADGFNSDELPVLTKARIIGNKNNGILIKYEYCYHWHILTTFIDPYNWENKENMVVWRGNGNTSLLKKYNRYTFIQKYFDKYNVGFTCCNNSNHNIYIKDKMDLNSQLKYKYLICLEGNDVATSLKWQLMSNSVVIMSKPLIEGWLMEGLLQPYVHYVPLKDDFSDLPEIIEWCKLNDDKCKEISINSTVWMQQFMNLDTEILLHDKITEWYKNNITFIE